MFWDTALALSRYSEGAYDVTIGHLVNVWGFGPPNNPFHNTTTLSHKRTLPDQKIRAKAAKQIGYQYLDVDAKQHIIKKSKDIFIDLSSIAKGYGVDQVASTLERMNIANYMVEVGGEIRLGGRTYRRQPWRIAVLSPDIEQKQCSILLRLTGKGVSTSGDYFNYYEIDNARYSHTIDPRTGAPKQNAIASVTVVAENAMRADGYKHDVYVVATI